MCWNAQPVRTALTFLAPVRSQETWSKLRGPEAAVEQDVLAKRSTPAISRRAQRNRLLHKCLLVIDSAQVVPQISVESHLHF
jgi:hypothetical protein